AAASGGMACGRGKHGSAKTTSGIAAGKAASKRAVSSEEDGDSCLEPDMVELRPDESGLALGAEACNTFASDGEIFGGESASDAFEKGRPKDPSDKGSDGKVAAAAAAVAAAAAASASPGAVVKRSTDAAGKLLKSSSESSGSGGEASDDYNLYFYISVDAAKEEDKPPESVVEEKEDVFAGVRPLELESFMEVLFACAEALYSHGYAAEACQLAIELANELLGSPPDLKVEQPQTKGKKAKVSTHRQTLLAASTLSKAAFLISVLSERSELHGLAFVVGLFALELQRPPASTKALEVRLAYQESEIMGLLKKIPLGVTEMSVIRERAEQLRDGGFCDYRPVLPLMLASFIFDVLCTPVVVSSTGSRPPSRNRNSQLPGDEELGFEAAITALGMHPSVWSARER
uniref:Uncharacterized protein n=1 Tax=Petromyzon marinus TaxID=7757 RepID=S4RA58_PETMA